MKFSCPWCAQHYDGDETWLDKTFVCSRCGRSVTVNRSIMLPDSPGKIPPAAIPVTRAGNCSATGMLGVGGNLVWLLCGGVLIGVMQIVAGVCCCVTIIGIPFGLQYFKLAQLTFWPFNREVVHKKSAVGAISVLMNVLWIVVFGGLIAALGNLILGVLFCVSLIGIPFGLQFFKLAVLTFSPFGVEIRKKEAVPVTAAAAAPGYVSSPAPGRGSRRGMIAGGIAGVLLLLTILGTVWFSFPSKRLGNPVFASNRAAPPPEDGKLKPCLKFTDADNLVADRELVYGDPAKIDTTRARHQIPPGIKPFQPETGDVPRFSPELVYPVSAPDSALEPLPIELP